MAHEHSQSPPKQFSPSPRFTQICIALAAIGLITHLVTAYAVEGQAGSSWNGYLIGFWFTLSLGLAGPFFASTQSAAIAGWFGSIRRVPEAFGAWLIPAFVLAMYGGLAGGSHLFHWWDAAYVASDHILQKKAGFLNSTAFFVSNVCVFLAWILVWRQIRKLSIEQDETGDAALTDKMRVLSCIFLVVFTVGISLLSWYWIMSLEPHWFSTMFNVYAFAGLFQSGLALTVIVVLHLMDKGYFGDYAGVRQIHDLGQLLFGFTVFYAYIAFCQFMLIWYANIPEEGIWYVARGMAPKVDGHGWQWASLALPFIKFAIPFLVLLRQDYKKNKHNILRMVAYALFFVQLFEVWYWVAPTPHAGHSYAVEGFPKTFIAMIHFPLVELLIAAGFIGAFGLVVSKALASQKLVPENDPFLHEAVGHHNHGTKAPKPKTIKIS